jgi:ABC-2 type transport system ATP-binding protein
MDEAEHCHRIAFIQHGKLIASGSPQQLKDSIMTGRVVQIYPTDTARTIELLRKASGIGELTLGGVALYGAFVHVILPEDSQKVDAIESHLKDNGIELHSIRVIEPSLEDVFIACMD